MVNAKASKWDDALSRPAFYALAAANLFPLAGLALFDWAGESIVALYFFEAVVIYLITARMLVLVGAEQNRPLVGGYLLRYGVGLVMMAVIWMGMFGQRFQISALFDRGLLLSAGTLLAAHVISYMRDFVGTREYERTPWKTVEGRMLSVYFVLFIVPLVLVVFAFVASPPVVAAVLVLTKTYVAAGAYASERARAAEGEKAQHTGSGLSTAPCPHCGKPLRTPQAKQCPHCLTSWHDTKAA
jgi:hypothetical protein